MAGAGGARQWQADTLTLTPKLPRMSIGRYWITPSTSLGKCGFFTSTAVQ
jgi:hypothetical protein